MNCLLIDVGSSSIKYGVYDDTSGQMSVFTKKEFPLGHVCCENRFIVSREEIENSIQDIFQQTEAYECKKAFISVQMHGYIIKREDDTFSEYISWRDKSGNVEQVRFKNINFNRMGTALTNKPWGIITTDRKLIDCAKESGVNMICCGSELNMLISGCKKIREEI